MGQHSMTNIYIIGLPEGEEREKRAEILFEEIMAENFPKLEEETDIQIQEAQRVPDKISPKRSTPKHITIKMSKGKNRREY